MFGRLYKALLLTATADCLRVSALYRWLQAAFHRVSYPMEGVSELFSLVNSCMVLQ